MLRKLILPVIFFFPLAIIQLAVIPLIAFQNIIPDIIVILVVFFTLKNGQIYGTVLGFILGFLFDLMSGGLIGSAMFAKTLSGFTAGYFYKEKKSESYLSSYIFVAIVFLCGTIDSLFYSMFSAADANLTLTFLLFEVGLLPGVYTAIFSLPVIIFKPGTVLQ